jgi:hypothetical protein
MSTHFPQSVINGTEKLLVQVNTWFDRHPCEGQIILIMLLIIAVLLRVAIIFLTVLCIISCLVACKRAYRTEAVKGEQRPESK